MAKTALVYAQPGVATPTLRITNPTTDAIAQVITLTEATNTPGKYTGTITAAAGTYHAVLLSGATPTAIWSDFRVEVADPSSSIAVDGVWATGQPRFGEQFLRESAAHNDGNKIYETRTDQRLA